MKTQKSEKVTMVAVGDVVLSRERPEEAFAKVMTELKSETFSCCNFEAPLSNRGTPQYAKYETIHSPPEMIKGFLHAGFKVVSLANNHSMDYGSEALIDTIETLDASGILHAGAGRNVEEARKPAFFDAGGMRFAFVSFATEAFMGYGANAHKPGIALIRQDALYGPSCVNPDDVEALAEGVKGAKKEADFVIAAFHWGLSQSRVLIQSQVVLGRTAVKSGAGLVIGHHPHVLQGVEVYRGSLILYSLGNFVFDLMPAFLGPATRESVLVKVNLSGRSVKEAYFFPVLINAQGQPERLDERMKKNQEILETMRRLSASRKTALSVKNGVGHLKVGKPR
jgi:gamma-polyglutamate biosynthesis protein CapA